jgi:hypothetical protein
MSSQIGCDVCFETDHRSLRPLISNSFGWEFLDSNSKRICSDKKHLGLQHPLENLAFQFSDGVLI